MGVKQSKQSVDISSTPKKGAGPDGDINNGKTAAEVKEVEATKVNGAVEANGEATPANGEAKTEDKKEVEAAAEEKKEGEAEAEKTEEKPEGEAAEGNKDFLCSHSVIAHKSNFSFRV